MRDLHRVRDGVSGFKGADLKVIVMTGIDLGAPKMKHRFAVGVSDRGTVLEQELKLLCRNVRAEQYIVFREKFRHEC